MKFLFWPVAIGLAIYGYIKWQEREEMTTFRSSLLVQSASPSWRERIQRRVNEEQS